MRFLRDLLVAISNMMWRGAARPQTEVVCYGTKATKSLSTVPSHSGPTCGRRKTTGPSGSAFFFLIVAAWLCFGQRPALEARFNEYRTIITAEESKPFKTIEWYKATAAQKNVQAQKQSQVAEVIAYLKTPARWTDNPLDALMMDQARADERNAALKPKVEAARQAAAEALATARAAQDAAAAAGYQDAGLNDAATAAIDSWQNAEKKASKAASGLAKPFNRIPTLIVLGLVLGALCTVGAVFMGMNPGKFFVSFLIIYALCVLANILGNQKTMRLYGINAEIWSIAIGMIIANTVGTPKLVKDGAQVEYFIKTGLVLLGAEVLFHKILAIGIPGIFVAWVVTPSCSSAPSFSARRCSRCLPVP